MTDRWLKTLALLGPSVISITCHSEVYMSEEQAARALFPDQKMGRSNVTLTADELQKISDISGEKVKSSTITVWKSPSGDCVFVDQVLGKHEFITFAVGIRKDGHVQGIEILEYRETYGNKVKEPDWKAQFVGKGTADPLKIDKDIKNLSGATLSSMHVTGGVRRLLWTYESVKTRI